MPAVETAQINRESLSVAAQVDFSSHETHVLVITGDQPECAGQVTAPRPRGTVPDTGATQSTTADDSKSLWLKIRKLREVLHAEAFTRIKRKLQNWSIPRHTANFFRNRKNGDFI